MAGQSSSWTTVAVRHVHPARAKDAYYVSEELQIDRPTMVELLYNEPEPWLDGTVDAPPGPYLVMVRSPGSPWIRLLPSREGLLTAEGLGRSDQLAVVAAAYDPVAGETTVSVYKRGRQVVAFAAAGEGNTSLQVRTFSASGLPKSLLVKARTVGDAVTKILKAFDVLPRPLHVKPHEDRLQLVDDAGRPLKKSGVAQVILRKFQPLIPAENPASVKLARAIERHDPQAAREAIAAGASLQFLPHRVDSPLAAALAGKQKGAWREVAGLLVTAGAPVDGYPWETPTIVDLADSFAEETAILASLELALELGADVNAVRPRSTHGFTALHHAVHRRRLGVVKWLVAHGARLDVPDQLGRTPLDFAAQSMGLPGDRLTEQAIHAVLQQAAAGGAKTDDAASMAQAAVKAERQARLRRRRVARDRMLAITKMAMRPSKRSTGEAATLLLPDTITLTPLAAPTWHAPAKVAQVERKLVTLGFERIDAFQIAEASRITLAAFRRAKGNLYAAIYEMGKLRSVDVFRFHRDGSSVVAAGAKAIVPRERPASSAVMLCRFPGAKVEQMVRWVLDRPERPAGTVPATAAAFPRLVAKAYAAEVRARKRAIREPFVR